MRGAVLASLALHALVLGVLAEMTDSPPTPVHARSAPSESAVVKLNEVASPPVPDTRREPKPTPWSEADDGSAPVQVVRKIHHARREGRRVRHGRRRTESKRTESERTESRRTRERSDTMPAESLDADTPQALALLDLRRFDSRRPVPDASSGAIAVAAEPEPWDPSMPGPAPPPPQAWDPSMPGPAPPTEADGGELASGSRTAVPSAAPSGPAPREVVAYADPEDAGFRLRRRGRHIYKSPTKDGRWKAELLDDGRVHFKDRARVSTLVSKVQGVEQHVLQKKRFLDQTSEVRLAVAQGFARNNMINELSALDDDLRAIWRSGAPARTRRRELFETWDDCEEAATDGGSAIDDLRHHAGAVARRRVLAFIRRTLPADTPDAFTPSEIAAFNGHRLSTERFDPYD